MCRLARHILAVAHPQKNCGSELNFEYPIQAFIAFDGDVVVPLAAPDHISGKALRITMQLVQAIVHYQ
jgi:hypothetical protein